MPDTIRDGKGTGNLARVNASNRLDVASSVMPRIFYESKDNNNAFGVTTPHLTITTTGGRIMYLKNTSSTHNMILTDFRLSWNGGTTNHDLALLGSVVFGDGAPTANNTTSAVGNLNRSSNNTFDIDVEYWDEVGDGMTETGGASGLYFIVGQGSTHFIIDGAIILGANDTIAVNLQAEEIGEASINVLGFMEAK